MKKIVLVGFLFFNQSVLANTGIFSCELNASICEKKDSYSTTGSCDSEKSLTKESFELKCPIRKDFPLTLDTPPFPKKILVTQMCGLERSLGLYIAEFKDDTFTIGRLIGLATTSDSAPFLRLNSTVTQDNGNGGDTRLLFNVSCVRKAE